MPANSSNAPVRGNRQTERRPGMLELGPGALQPSLLPSADLLRSMVTAVADERDQALSYGANAGPASLRAFLADRVGAVPEQVATTGGTSAALGDIATRLAREGRAVLTESLTYDLGRAVFEQAGVPTVPIPGPDDDVDPDALRRTAVAVARRTRRPPACYLVPTFHNPTGRVLSEERRRQILEVAEDLDLLVVEDQAYADLSYDGRPPAPLHHLAEDPARVIAVYTFSKCFAPGWRLGWLVADPSTVRKIESDAVRVSGGGPTHVGAMLMQALTGSGAFDRHLATLVGELRARRDALLAGLDGRLPDGFAPIRPGGGYFVWVRIPTAVSTADLLRAAESRGLSFTTGQRFGAGGHGVRICFAAAGADELATAAKHFRAVCRAGTRL